ncbi:MAG: DUF58 domain-containing protein, partial [Steroidobacteraceae bacterium]
MRPPADFLPARTLPLPLAGAAALALALRLLGVPASAVLLLAAALLLLLALAWLLDRALTASAWDDSAVTLQRRLPQAFALGVRGTIRLALAMRGEHAWRLALHDHLDEHATADSQPLQLELAPGSTLEASYRVLPRLRGPLRLAPAELRIRSRLGLGELRRRVGAAEERRVLPDFSQVARYGWLAGDRRLMDIGIRSFVRRGEGTDFRQLAEYQPGDSVRHIDWKASARAGRPIVREFQDERDQAVVLLLDCGRRMRAEEGDAAAIGSHFDHVLNGVLLLAYVALRHGDAVGALPFADGGPPRYMAPRKGATALNGLMAALGELQPTLEQPDYLAAARALMTRQRKRALVIIVTNFRDEDGEELQAALRLLRTRHLVMVASLRERVVGRILRQPLADAAATLEVA